VRDRLGLRPDQANTLVRVVLRPLDHTLTDAEANELRDRIYARLHEGLHVEWAYAAGRPPARHGPQHRPPPVKHEQRDGDRNALYG
jgi:uncharacterized protein (DUF2267 family)